MLKNYTVRIKNVRVDKMKLIINYLHNDSHKNHTKKNTEIISISDRENFEKITSSKIEKNAQNYIRNGKGGKKLKVSSKSLTFNTPKNYACTEKQLKTINTKLNEEIIKLYKTYNVEITENEIYSVIHKQENSHIHTILPYLDIFGNCIRETKSKRFLHELKLRFTVVTDNVLGTSFKDYEKLSEAQNDNNRVIDYLNELKGFYESYLALEDSKYYKNQIVMIDRVLKENPIEVNSDIEKITKNSEKVQDLRIKSKIVTKKLPTI